MGSSVLQCGEWGGSKCEDFLGLGFAYFQGVVGDGADWKEECVQGLLF